MPVARHLEQVGTDGIDPVGAGDPIGGRVEQLQPSRGTVDHRRGDGAIQADDRVAGHPLERAVEGEDLRPIGVFCP